MFTRARLALMGWYIALITLTILALGATAYFLVRDGLDDEIDGSLHAATAQLQAANRLPETPGDGASGSGDGHDADDSRDDDHDGSDHDDESPPAGLLSDVFYVLFQDDGTIVSNPRRVDLKGVDLAAMVEENHHGGLRDVDGEDARYRLSITEWDAPGASYLAVGRSLRLRDHQLENLTTVFILGGLAGVAVAGLSGFWLAGRTLAPIRRSFESQQQFVSDASHELRTPLAIARLQLEILTENTDDTVEAHMEQVAAVDEQVDRMAALVGDLLTLARADEGRDNLVVQSLDLRHLAGEVAHDMQALAELRGITLKAELQPVAARGDQARLRQLLVILLDNALKYTPSGGSVTVSCRQDGHQAELAVTDTGPGIAPADQRRIFERFYRADSARARATGGTGLGLAIAAWIARAHGGRITVQSEPGKGATFRVRLPRA